MYYTNPFDMFFGTSPRYIVISDSELARLRQDQLGQEITVLESKLNRYQTAIQEVKVELKSKKDLYKEAGALNGSQTTETLPQSGAGSDT